MAASYVVPRHPPWTDVRLVDLAATTPVTVTIRVPCVPAYAGWCRVRADLGHDVVGLVETVLVVTDPCRQPGARSVCVCAHRHGHPFRDLCRARYLGCL